MSPRPFPTRQNCASCSRSVNSLRGGHGFSITVARLAPFCAPLYPPFPSSLFTLPCSSLVAVVKGAKFCGCARPDEAPSLRGRRVRSFPANGKRDLGHISRNVDTLTVRTTSIYNLHNIILFVAQEGARKNRLVGPYRPYQLSSPPQTHSSVPLHDRKSRMWHVQSHFARFLLGRFLRRALPRRFIVDFPSHTFILRYLRR